MEEIHNRISRELHVLEAGINDGATSMLCLSDIAHPSLRSLDEIFSGHGCDFDFVVLQEGNVPSNYGGEHNHRTLVLVLHPKEKRGKDFVRRYRKTLEGRTS